MNTLNPKNMIPGVCFVTLNYRFSPHKSKKEALSKIVNLVGEENIEFLDIALPYVLEEKKYKKFLILNKEVGIMQAWTDISQLNSLGIPSINYGVGDISLAHSNKERVSILELNAFYEDLKKHI